MEVNKNKPTKKKFKKSADPVKVLNMILIGKFTDGKVRQFIFDEDAQRVLMTILASISPTKSPQVLETPLENINWESSIDLSK